MELNNIVSLIDLTDLSDNCTDENIIHLCHKGDSPLGPVASVCVYPEFIPLAKKNIKNKSIKLTTVINFPEGNDGLHKINSDIKMAMDNHADEIDFVMPYEKILSGDIMGAEEVLVTARELTQHKTLKIILETSEYADLQQLTTSAKLAIKTGADFLKTSSGKTKSGATIDMALHLLKIIKTSGRDIGLKLSGGIKQIYQAQDYIKLTEKIMGENWINPAHLRFGTSSLLDNILLKTQES